MKGAHIAALRGGLLVRSTAITSLSLALLACGGGEAGGGGDAKTPSAKRSTSIEHEPCEGGKADAVDVNGDGKPDIRRVYGGSGREACRVTDLNRNGKPDLFQYFDAAGNLRRREADYDESGVVDAIEHYENGKLVRVEYDTLARHQLDTWDFYDPATAKRIRRERDSRGTGHIDQWWTWEGEKVSIAFDRNGDGQPDPTETLVLGGSGGGPAPVDAGPPPSTASTLAALDGGGVTPSPQAPATPAPASEKPMATDAGAPKTKPRGK